MEFLWKCAAIGISAAALGLTIRSKNPEQAFLLGLLAAVLILAGTMTCLRPVQELLKTLENRGNLSPSLLLPVLKGLGLAILGKTAESVCRDAGQGTAALAMELATSCAILCAAMPLLEELADVVFSLS